jgi:predicted DNA-binding transcriptional regulator AlpA
MPREPIASANTERTPADDLLTMREVCAITRYSRPSIYRLIREAKFPHPLKLGAAKIVFNAAEVAEWRKSRPRALGGDDSQKQPAI